MNIITSISKITHIYVMRKKSLSVQLSTKNLTAPFTTFRPAGVVHTRADAAPSRALLGGGSDPLLAFCPRLLRRCRGLGW